MKYNGKKGRHNGPQKKPPTGGQAESAAPVRKSGRDTNLQPHQQIRLGQQVVWINRNNIEPNPLNPRRYFDPTALHALGRSMREQGQVQPCVVRPHPTADPLNPQLYELIVGERRWRVTAPQYADLPRLQCIVASVSDFQAMRMAWDENEQREDITAIERARALRKLREVMPGKTTGRPATWPEVAAEVNLTRESVIRLVQILDLPENILDEYFEPASAAAWQRALQQERKNVESNGVIFVFNERHGRALRRLKHHPAEQMALARWIRAESMSGNEADRKAGEFLERVRREARHAGQLAEAPGPFGRSRTGEIPKPPSRPQHRWSEARDASAGDQSGKEIVLPPLPSSDPLSLLSLVNDLLAVCRRDIKPEDLKGAEGTALWFGLQVRLGIASSHIHMLQKQLFPLDENDESSGEEYDIYDDDDFPE